MKVVIGRLPEDKAREFASMHAAVTLGSKSASGFRRIQTAATGGELFRIRDELAMFAPEAVQSRVSVPVLSPGIRDPIPCVPCVQSHDQAWADHPGNISEHMSILKAFVTGREPLPDAPQASQDGIVYVGGGRYWPGIVVGVKILRSTGCTLPVQVWHRADEPVISREVAGLGVELIDSTSHAREHGGARILGGWEAKLWALTHCGLKNVLFLDADAYCVDDPTSMIRGVDGGEPFQFWQDQPAMANSVLWKKVWKAGDNGVPQVQGGQLLIDIPRAWRLLCVVHWLNQHSDFYYKHVYGDQDTWRVALAAFNDRTMWRNRGPAEWKSPAFVIGEPPIIVHRCRAKLFTDMNPQPHRHLPKEDQVFAWLNGSGY